MAHAMRTLLVVLGLLYCAGCASNGSNNADLAPPCTPCQVDTDCDPTQTCVSKACRTRCVSSEGCGGAVCFPADGGTGGLCICPPS
jgi:hypothetical protein